MAALRSRIAGDGGPYALLDPVALHEAEELFACTTDPRDIAETCHLVAMLHWSRAEVFRDERVQGEVFAAFPLFMVLNESRSRFRLPDGASASLPRETLAPAVSDTSWLRPILMFDNWLNNQGGAHVLRLAVNLGRNAMADTYPGHPQRMRVMSFLVSASHLLFEVTGDLAESAQAIAVGTQAVTEARTDEDMAMSLSGLAGSLRARYESLGDIRLLQEAIDAYRRALTVTPVGHGQRFVLLTGLGLSLYLLHERTGDQASLDEAQSMSSAALRTVPEDDRRLAAVLVNHSNLLRAQFVRTGRQDLLNEAIATARKAVDIVTPLGEGKQACLHTVSLLLGEQFDRTGDLIALEEAIEAGQAALDATPVGHADAARYGSHLANQLAHHFRRTGDLSKLDKAITLGRSAVDATPLDHPNKGIYLGGLAAALSAKAVHTEDLNLTRQAIACHRLAAEAITDWRQVGPLTNLVNALSVYFDRTGEIATLEAAIETGRRAVAAVSENAPYRAQCEVNLAAVLTKHGQAAGDVWSLTEAIDVLEAAATTESARPMIRVEAARGWGRLAMSLGQTERAVRGFSLAVGLLPRLSARGLNRKDATRWMAEYARLAGDAAACSLAAGRAEQAVELLEMGRGVLLAQSLDLRTELTDVRDRDPALAERFAFLCEQLDTGDDPGRPLASGDYKAFGHSVEAIADRRREMAEELVELITRIRSMPGMDRFLSPPDVAGLLAEASKGPIVLINISEYRCDALILTPDGVQVQELPGLTVAEAHARLDAMHDALSRMSSARRDRLSAEQVMHATLAWLWDVVTGPVLERLRITDRPVGDHSHTRVWWVPCGVLALFPLHAAGHHLDQPGSRCRTVFDRAVSSYSPTVRGLAHARAGAARRRTGHPTMLAVAMPHTEGARDLPNAKKEFDELTRLFPGLTGLTGEDATRDAVLSELQGSGWVHFACHAAADPVDPFGSQLLVHDHARRPLTVLEVSRLRLTECEFAYLSACSTAITTLRLADECIHAVSAFQLAGYPHVVGTLWEIGDAIAAEIAVGIYEDLLSNGSDPASSGSCLHRVMRTIRDRYPHQPTLWAAHIHMGA